VCGEHLGLLGRDHSSAWHYRSHDTTNSLNTKRKRCDIQEDKILSHIYTSNDSGLDSCTVSDCLVWINAPVWLLSIEELLDEGLDFGDTS